MSTFKNLDIVIGKCKKIFSCFVMKQIDYADGTVLLNSLIFDSRYKDCYLAKIKTVKYNGSVSIVRHPKIFYNPRIY